jgi:hypothetical protein
MGFDCGFDIYPACHDTAEQIKDTGILNEYQAKEGKGSYGGQHLEYMCAIADGPITGRESTD